MILVQLAVQLEFVQSDQVKISQIPKFAQNACEKVESMIKLILYGNNINPTFSKVEMINYLTLLLN